MAKSKKAAKKTVKKAAKKATKPAAKKAKAPVAKKAASGIIADVEHLMHMMAANDVTEIDIADGKNKISLKRGHAVVAAAPAVVAAPAAAPVAAAPSAPAVAADAPAAAEDDCLTIESPMVGTFYAAASPDADPFVKVGDTVTPDTVVCIVEAMKVMNEIKAEVSGTIVEICAKNAQGVEFGQVMFKIKA